MEFVLGDSPRASGHRRVVPNGAFLSASRRRRTNLQPQHQRKQFFGMMQSVSGSKVAFEIIQADVNQAFINRAKLPLAILDFSHVYVSPVAKNAPAKLLAA